MKLVILIFVCCTIALAHSKSVQLVTKDDGLFPLTIIHINDFHARFEEINLESNTCKEDDVVCIGGYARVVTMVKQLQATSLNPIYLNAGDNFQGTLWYNLLRHNVTSHFLNKLPADAITIGNHEFDHKIEGIVPFLEALKSPVVVSNIDDSNEPTFQRLYTKSTVIEKFERKIGVIGVILSTTNQIAQTENLKFLDESKSVAAEAEKLNSQGIDIIIVLSHCGLDVDFIIAKNGGPYIDVIVGGHSHTFMYTGTDLPGNDIPRGNYPEHVYQANGHQVLIVQAAAYTKYVGNLTVWFDDKGDIVTAEGAPIYLDKSVIPDPEISNDLLPFKDIVDVEANKLVGHSFVRLEADDCNTGDCNIGNLIADSMTHSFINEQTPEGWAIVTVAMTNVGGIRTTLPQGTLTFGDLKTTTPFDNTIDLFDLRGDYLWNAIEYSVTKSFEKDYFYGANILQTSGLKIVANVTKPIGERVLSVDVLCRKCRIPIYEPLKKEEIYRIAATSFLAGGGDGFTMINKYKKNVVFEEINLQSNTCKEDDDICIGGYARVVTMVKQLQATSLNPIYLNAGDNFQGTLWYNMLRHNVTSLFLNKLPADAITIGNHEFDHKIEGIVPFLEALTSPVVVSNIDDTDEPTFQRRYTKSILIEKYGRKIGVIGVILSTTNQIAQTEKLKFLDESKSVAAEAEKLNSQGVDIIIVLSHCGLDVDFIIAKNGGPYIDVIVGGHSHTFMYTGTDYPGNDIPRGNYPEHVYQDNGHEVLIVQAAAYTKYVGNLTVWFDDKGDIVTAEGAPIYLDKSVIPDPEISNDLLPFKDIVDVEANKLVGYSFVNLRKSDCNTGDCNIGNLIADSMVHSFINEQDPEGWAIVTVAMTNVGGIRTTLPQGTLTFGDLKTTLPFDNTIDLLDLRGDYLWNAIEYSLMISYEENTFVGANTLQTSGLKIVANVTNPIGERVVSVDVLCRKCRVPIYEPLKREEMYRIAAGSFLAGGGDGFTMINKHKQNVVFEETNPKSNTCKQDEKCIGGYARVVTMVKQLQATSINPIYLNAGDNFQGTLWYNLLRHNVTSHFLNKLPADAITIGNHEFDHKIRGVVPFLKALTSPVVISNIDDTAEPTLQGLYTKSIVIEKYKRKIGVIGVMLSTTNQIAQTEKLKFLDESKSVAAEAEKLNSQGVDIIIVLSHCGLDVDFIIAKNGGPYIDVIVGGHSHTFMYNGTEFHGIDVPRGKYPEHVYQDNGHEVLIVQAAAFTKYVGNLTVWFDEKGNIVTVEGAPIYLDESVIPDPDTVKDLLPYKAIVDVQANKVVGYSFVDLEKMDCHLGDCNLGNFIADGMVYSFINEENYEGWAKVTVAITNVGGIRVTLAKGTLTFGDLKTTLPFDNTIDLYDLRGDYLWNAIEYSVTKSFRPDLFIGANLLQSSGLKVVANVTKPIGERVVSIDVLCRKCRVPKFEPLNKKEIYRIAMPSFLANGGDGFTMISKNKKMIMIGGLDIDAFETYVKKRSPVMPISDGRLKILT